MAAGSPASPPHTARAAHVTRQALNGPVRLPRRGGRVHFNYLGGERKEEGWEQDNERKIKGSETI